MPTCDCNRMTDTPVAEVAKTFGSIATSELPIDREIDQSQQ